MDDEQSNRAQSVLSKLFGQKFVAGEGNASGGVSVTQEEGHNKHTLAHSTPATTLVNPMTTKETNATPIAQRTRSRYPLGDLSMTIHKISKDLRAARQRSRYLKAMKQQRENLGEVLEEEGEIERLDQTIEEMEMEYDDLQIKFEEKTAEVQQTRAYADDVLSGILGTKLDELKLEWRDSKKELGLMREDFGELRQRVDELSRIPEMGSIPNPIPLPPPLTSTLGVSTFTVTSSVSRMSTGRTQGIPSYNVRENLYTDTSSTFRPGGCVPSSGTLPYMASSVHPESFFVEQQVHRVIPRFSEKNRDKPCTFLKTFKTTMITLKVPRPRHFDLFVAAVEVESSSRWNLGWPTCTSTDGLYRFFLQVFWTSTIQYKLYNEFQTLTFHDCPLLELRERIEDWTMALEEINTITINPELLPLIFIRKLPYKLYNQLTPEAENSMPEFLEQLSRVVDREMRLELLENMKFIPGRTPNNFSKKNATNRDTNNNYNSDNKGTGPGNARFGNNTKGTGPGNSGFGNKEKGTYEKKNAENSLQINTADLRTHTVAHLEKTLEPSEYIEWSNHTRLIKCIDPADLGLDRSGSGDSGVRLVDNVLLMPAEENWEASLSVVGLGNYEYVTLRDHVLVGDGVLSQIDRYARTLKHNGSGSVSAGKHALVSSSVDCEKTLELIRRSPRKLSKAVFLLSGEGVNFEQCPAEEFVDLTMRLINTLVEMGIEHLLVILPPPPLKYVLESASDKEKAFYLTYISNLVSTLVRQSYYGPIVELGSEKTLVTVNTYLFAHTSGGEWPRVTRTFPDFKFDNLIYDHTVKELTLKPLILQNFIQYLIKKIDRSQISKANPIHDFQEDWTVNHIKTTPVQGHVDPREWEKQLTPVSGNRDLTVTVEIAGVSYQALIDTGAVISLINPVVLDLLRQIAPHTDLIEGTLNEMVPVYGVSGQVESSLKAAVLLKLNVYRKKQIWMRFYVPSSMGQDLIIGADMLDAYQGVILVHSKIIHLTEPHTHSKIRLSLTGSSDRNSVRISTVSPLKNQLKNQEATHIKGELWRKLLSSVTQGVVPMQVALELQGKLERNWEVFESTLGKWTGSNPKIEVDPTLPWINRSYPIPAKLVPAVRELVSTMESQGIIHRSTSAYLNPLVVVKKSNGQLRICIDAQNFNSMVIRQCVEPPSITNLLYGIREEEFMSSLDLAQGFLQIEIDPEISKYLAFNVEGQTYEYRRLPFGTSVSPAVFMSVINKVLAEEIGHHVHIYVDDILIGTNTLAEHIDCLDKVLSKLRKAGLKVSIQKTNLLLKTTKHLGFILGKGVIAKDANKYKWFEDFERKLFLKTNATGVGRKVKANVIQSLLGFTLYYSMFIPEYTSLTAPFQEALTQNHFDPIIWTSDLYNAYCQLKQHFCASFALIKPNYTRPFNLHLYIDNSSRRGHGVLTQYDEQGIEKVNLFYSKCLTSVELRYSVQEKYLYLLFQVLSKLKPILYGSEINIDRQYHTLLSLASTLATYVTKFGRWTILYNSFNLNCVLKPFAKSTFGKLVGDSVPGITLTEDDSIGLPIEGFDDPLVKTGLHEKAKELGLTDMTQIDELILKETIKELPVENYSEGVEIDYCGVTLPPILNDLNENLERHQKADPKLAKIRKGLHNKNPKIIAEYSLEGGELYRKMENDSYRIPVLPSHFSQEFIKYLHRFYNHPGSTKLTIVTRRFFWWTGQGEEIKRLTKSCLNCRRNKVSNRRLIPEFGRVRSNKLGSKLSVDLYGPLPKSKWGHTAIIVVRDIFSGYVWAYSMRDTNAGACADRLEKVVRDVSEKGAKVSQVLSDNGVQFRSKEWRTRCRKLDVKPVYTATYTPNSNPVERVMREIGKGLRLYFNQIRTKPSTDNTHRGWGHCLSEIVNVINDLPAKNAKYTPNDFWGITSPENPLEGRTPKLPSIEKEIEKLENKFAGSPGDGSGDSFLVDHNGDTMVYVDGGCLRNGRKESVGAFAAWFNGGHSLNMVRLYRKEYTTNNKVELLAILKALKIGIKNNITNLVVVSDSLWSISEIQKALDRPGCSKTHKEVIQEILECYPKFERVSLRHVHGHSCDIGNLAVDSMVAQVLVEHEGKVEPQKDDTVAGDDRAAFEKYLGMLDLQEGILREIRYNKQFENQLVFEPGAWVLIKTHPLSNANEGRVAKLEIKREGPYLVKRKLGVNLYLVEKEGRLVVVNIRQMMPYQPSENNKKGSEAPIPVQERKEEESDQEGGGTFTVEAEIHEVPREENVSLSTEVIVQEQTEEELEERKVTFNDRDEYSEHFFALVECERKCQQKFTQKKVTSSVKVKCEDQGDAKIVTCENSKEVQGLGFSVGDEVELKDLDWKEEGIIIKSDKHLVIRLWSDTGTKIPEQATVGLRWNPVPFQRMETALKKFQEKRGPLPLNLYRKLLGLRIDTESHVKPVTVERPEGARELNESQQEAIISASQNSLSLIQGPPGTGKTETAAALVYQLCTQYGAPILVCAGSNNAVDLLADRISKLGLVVRRLYSKRITRLKEKKLNLESTETGALGKTNISSMTFHNTRLTAHVAQTRSQGPSKVNEHDFKHPGSFDGVHVICCTCIEAGSGVLDPVKIKTLVVDEASQITEPEVLVPIVQVSNRIVLIGDQKQLGPVIRSGRAGHFGLGHSLFERLHDLKVNSIILKQQYRMHSELMQFSSLHFYNNIIINAVPNSARTLGLLENWWINPLIPIMFFHVEGKEGRNMGTNSRYNLKEITKTKSVVHQLLSRGLAESQLGIITGYEAQRIRLSRALGNLVKVANVDGFQGEERDIIILSLVRSNTQKLGFLTDPRRINVALTRARYGLVLIGNTRTLSQNEWWSKLLSYYQGLGVIKQ